MNIYEISSEGQILFTYFTLTLMVLMYLTKRVADSKLKEFISITKICNPHSILRQKDRI